MTALFDRGPTYEAYAVPCLPDEGQAWEVRGGTRPYRVELNAAGEFSCDCPHWRKKARFTAHRMCKHCYVVKELIEQSPRVESEL
jgi:hypothetical protein